MLILDQLMISLQAPVADVVRYNGYSGVGKAV